MQCHTYVMVKMSQVETTLLQADCMYSILLLCAAERLAVGPVLCRVTWVYRQNVFLQCCVAQRNNSCESIHDNHYNNNCNATK